MVEKGLKALRIDDYKKDAENILRNKYVIFNELE